MPDMSIPETPLCVLLNPYTPNSYTPFCHFQQDPRRISALRRMSLSQNPQRSSGSANTASLVLAGGGPGGATALRNASGGLGPSLPTLQEPSDTGPEARSPEGAALSSMDEEFMMLAWKVRMGCA
jgi:hypothetical protein